MGNVFKRCIAPKHSAFKNQKPPQYEGAFLVLEAVYIVNNDRMNNGTSDNNNDCERNQKDLKKWKKTGSVYVRYLEK